MTAPRYATAAAMRTALERRLLAQHSSTALPLDRLRKEAALQRLLARIVAVAPEDSWALKGGIAMIARVGDRARATADADATWRASRSQLGGMLDRAAGLDLADYFELTIGQGRPIQGEGTEGGIRFPVTARLASKMFENGGFVADYRIEFATLDSAYDALVKFWRPVLADGPASTWNADTWTWR